MSTVNNIESMRMDVQKLEMNSIADKLLSWSKKGGASATSIDIGRSQGVSIEVRHAKVETLEFNQDCGVSVTVYLGKKKGNASTTDCSDEGLKATVNAALSIAKFTEEDPCSGLAEAELYPQQYPDLDLYHPWETSIEGLIELAQIAESTGLEADQRIVNSDGAGVSCYENIHLKANSSGLCGFSQGTRHGVNTVLIAEDPQGMERDYYYTTSRNPDNLLEASSVGLKAAQRVLARLHSGEADQGYFPILFAPEIARGLVGHYLSAISGGALYRNSSFLMDSIGQQIFPEWLDIDEDPHIKQGLASAIFDADGVATTKKQLLSKGTVERYLLSSYSARKLNLVTTANAGGAFNLELKGPQTTPTEMMQLMNRGLMVTEVMGQGVNQVTGDYSRGASGFWIENGEIAFPVRGVTIAGNLKHMFKGIQAIGNDLDHRSSILTGSVLVDKMTVACQ